MSVKLICHVKTIIVFFYKFDDFFCRRHSLMNRLCYNNLYQFMRHDNFRNLNMVISTYWKHLQSQINAFWFCFPVIKRYTFNYSIKSALIPGNHSSFRILQLFDIWRYQGFVILFFSFCFVFNLRWMRMCSSCMAGQSSFSRNVT